MSARGVSRGVVARACGGLRRSLACRALIVGVVASICVPVGAGAEEQPAILKAYGLDWIERVKEEAWPQPRLERPVLCLLDTGVNITPDTPADDLNGPIVARLALDGGTGTAQGDGYPYDHGTQMASIIAAPRNGWGTVGVFPQARIVSIRVTEGTEQFISPTSIRQGVRRCVQFADEIKVRLAVVTIAETNYAQRPVDVPYWDRARQFARDSDTLVIAAAGNDADSGAVAPLAVPDILSVSAGTDSGEKCPFVAQLDQTPALRGPGCSKTPGWPAGSSAATSAVAALAAALRTGDVVLSESDTRGLISRSAVPAAGQQVFAAGGLASRFPLLPPSLQIAPPSGPTGVIVGKAEPQSSQTVRVWRPTLRARWSRGILVVRRVDRSPSGRLAIDCLVGAKRRAVTSRAVARDLSVRAAKRPRMCRGWIESKKLGFWRSLSVRFTAT